MAVKQEPNDLNVETTTTTTTTLIAVDAVWHCLCMREGRIPSGIFVESKTQHTKYISYIDFKGYFFFTLFKGIIKTDLLWVVNCLMVHLSENEKVCHIYIFNCIYYCSLPLVTAHYWKS